MIKEAISQLLEGTDLSPDLMRESMEEIMTGNAAPSQIGAFLALLRIKNETIEEITEAARVMRQKASKIEIQGPVLDTCSTGGTGINHFNISTSVAFVVAAMDTRVAKHGNRAASGKCGSADVLEKLGVKIDLEPQDVKKCIDEVNVGFLFAPKFHGAMKYAAGPRKEVGIRTIFNILGPLTNPASATHQILGVFKPELTETLAKVLGNLGTERAMVVHGDGGLDEISLSGSSRISELKDGYVTTYEITPDDFGLSSRTIEEIKGGDAQINAKFVKDIFNGEKVAFRDVVIANAAASFLIIGKAADLKQGVEIASESIDSKKALNKLNELIEFSNSL